MKYKASVIVPNWNGIKYIEICLNSLFNLEFDNFEIIVVDNGSFDGSKELVAGIFERENKKERGKYFCKHIKLPENYGFARACNEGVFVSEGEYVVLLNNDVEVDKFWLKELVSGMERHPECWMGTSKMIQYENHRQIYNTGDMFKVWGTGGGRGFGEEDRGQYENEEYVFGACAGAGIYRRELFDTVGYLDEDFFIFSEDVDLNLRMQLYGKRAVYLPKAVVYHWGTATVGFNSDRHVFLGTRNDMFVIAKNYTVGEYLKYLWKIFSFRVDVIKKLSFEGQGRVVFLSFLSFLAMLYKMAGKRLKSLSIRKLGMEDVEEVIK